VADTALIFERTGAPSTDLVFGDTGGVAPRVDLTVTGTLPGLTAKFNVFPPVLTEITGTLPGITATVTVRAATPVVLTGVFPGFAMLAKVTYHTQTQRPTVASLHTTAQVAAMIEGGISQPQQHAQQANSGVQANAVDATRANTGSTTGFANATDSTQAIAGAFEDGVPTRDTTHASMQDGDPQWLRFFSQFQEADRLAAAQARGQFEDGLRDRRANITGRWQEATRRTAVRYQGRGKPGVPIKSYLDSLFQDARVPPAGITVWPDPPVVPPPYWGTALVFQCPVLAYPALVFGVYPCDSAAPATPLQILPARFYMTAHSIYAQRLPDLVDIPIFAATVSADSGSYCWSLSASGPASLFDQLAPTNGLPAQLRLTLDGLPWIFAIDSISRSAQFGQTSVTIQGRSVTALIAAPYVRSESRIEADDKTAHQLALINLAGTGVDLDWGVGAGALANSGMIDWFVPAGAYSRQGTALESVSRIVQAAGGYLQSHRNLPTLLARHPYGMRAGDVSGAPWDWSLGAADIELAPDALITESVQRQDGPDINAVYVSGTSHGVLALVKRTGSAADKLANMVTDSLITHADAARQAGLAILGAAGHKYAVTLDLPVLTGAGQPGVIDVGQLVQVNASTPWRGRVRGVSVSAKQPSLRQTITLERHIA